MVAPERDVGPDRRRQSQQPGQDVEIVKALVEEHAAALARPGGSPAPARVIRVGSEPVGVDPVHADDAAQLARFDEKPQLLVSGFHAQLEHAAKHRLRISLVGCDQLEGVGLVGGNGLLDHEVHAGVEGGDAEVGVLVVRRGHQDGIDRARGDERTGVGPSDQGPVGLHLGRGRRTHGHQLAALHLAGLQVGGVVAADVAEADEAETEGLHAACCPW